MRDMETFVALLRELTDGEFNRVWGFALGAKAAREQQDETTD